ncbi:MAG: hypothetical protein ACR2LV_09105 [Solirubrobacteraceae bacterium]
MASTLGALSPVMVSGRIRPQLLGQSLAPPDELVVIDALWDWHRE